MPTSSRTATRLSATQIAALDDRRAVDSITTWQSSSGATEAGMDQPADVACARIGQTRLLIAGMHCAACSGTIEAALRAVPGVRSAEVSGAAERAVIVWDANQTRLSRLVEAIQDAGYGAFPDTGAQALNQARQESRQAVWRLFVAGFCMMQVMMYATPAYVAGVGDMSADMQSLLRWASWVLCIPVLVFAAGPYFRSAWAALRLRRIGMDVPVALGILVTFVAGSQATFSGQGEVYFDSLSMFVAVLLGARLLETRARRRAAQALDALVRRLPDTVERVADDGSSRLVAPAELRVGDHLRVQVGQAFAADGVLVQGRTQVDEAALTGESTPVERGVDDEVSAGCLNLGAPVLMRADRLGAQTRYQRIVALVERALTERPAFVQSTDRLAGPFLWSVLALAGLAWLGWHWVEPARATWIAVSVLIVTCPCALSIGAPVALIAATGQLARRGVLVQKLDALEVLTRIDTVVFDKTGTLTEDKLVPALTTPLTAEASRSMSSWQDQAARLGAYSRHPLARALAVAQTHAHAAHAAEDNAAAPQGDCTDTSWQDVTEQAGAGLQARCIDADSGQVGHWRLGSAAWCSVSPTDGDTPARPAVWLARLDGRDWQPQLRFEFDELMRSDAPAAIARLQDQGLSVHVLSGDQPASVATLLQRLQQRMPPRAAGHARPDIQWRAQCTPQDKLLALQDLQQAGRRVLMVGDGINDAPVLARADVSVAMGSAAALAQARADVVVLSNHIGDIEALHFDAARCLRIVRQNLYWALAYNLACVPLALAGWLPPWAAGLGMAASSLFVVLNALRLTSASARPTVMRIAAPPSTPAQPALVLHDRHAASASAR
ncbi:MAG: hypothetical protein RIQ60_4312 [Pseudomonadota bacterium]|jgi:Cu2+-exporting ATPase